MASGPLNVGIDIGGSAAKVGLVALDGSIVARSTIPTPVNKSPQGLLNSYINSIDHWRNVLGCELTAVGIGVPGHVTDRHRSTDVCNLKRLNRFPIADHVEEKLGLPVWIENDADVAGIGEYRFGAGRGSHKFLMVTLGTGIGTSFINGGLITVTANGTLGDIGHIIVDKQMRYKCRGGCLGCIESVASALALDRDALALAETHPHSYLGILLHEQQRNPSVQDVIKGARAGDRVCVDKMEDTAHWLGMWTASVIQIFGPDKVAFGGGWSTVGQEFVDRILHHARRMGVEHYYMSLEAVPAQLGNQAGFVGAASYAHEMVLAGKARLPRGDNFNRTSL